MADININTADMTLTEMIPAYKDGMSWQYFRDLANNTGYCYRRLRNGLWIANAVFEGLDSELDFDTERMYTDKCIFSISDYSGALWTDFSFDNLATRIPTFLQLSTAYQEFFASTFSVKFLPAGGVRIKKLVALTHYLMVVIRELQ